jgi:hypothetical protein
MGAPLPEGGHCAGCRLIRRPAETPQSDTPWRQLAGRVSELAPIFAALLLWPLSFPQLQGPRKAFAIAPLSRVDDIA